MRILIAEDDRVSALVLRRTLEKWGHEVLAAENGVLAWDAFQANRPCMVISDWMMPEMDGVTLCRRIRSLKLPRYTYVMLLTAKERREDRIEGLQAGADDFLGKPLDPGELFARLEVARRILEMEEQLRNRSGEMETLHAQVEQRNAELRDAMIYLTHANRRFTELFEGLPTACYSWDREGCIYEWNRTAVEMFGYQAGEVITRPLWEVFNDGSPRRQRDARKFTEATIERVFRGEAIIGLEVEKRERNGRTLQTLCNILPIRSPDGTITGGITALIDITARKELERQLAEQLKIANGLNAALSRQSSELAEANRTLSELVTTDGLTGLKNHRHFREVLDSTHAFTAREGPPYSVIMLDVDRFKQYNDSYGHPAGDEVLRSVARILKSNVRAYDLVARYGGEEFIVLCRSARQSTAVRLAERLRAAIEGFEWPLRPVTASFGVATFSLRAASASDLVDEADKALYHSKNDGRNRVSHFHAMNDESAKESSAPAV